MGAMVSQIASLAIVYSTVYSRHRSKKTPKLRATGLCAGNSPVAGEFPAQMASTQKMFPFDDVIMMGKINMVPNHNKTQERTNNPRIFFDVIYDL